jgi:hypothetical protein
MLDAVMRHCRRSSAGSQLPLLFFPLLFFLLFFLFLLLLTVTTVYLLNMKKI